MKSFFTNTRATIDHFDSLQEKMKFSSECTTDEEDTFLDEFQSRLANSLMLDYRGGWEKELKELGENILELSKKEKNA